MTKFAFLWTISLLLSATVALAAQKRTIRHPSAADSGCRARDSKLQPNASFSEIKKTLDKKPRLEVVQTAWTEMLKPNPDTSLAIPILHYLAGTEQADSLHGYYEALGMNIANSLPLVGAMRFWPKRVPGQLRTNLSLQELCELYVRAGGHLSKP